MNDQRAGINPEQLLFSGFSSSQVPLILIDSDGRIVLASQGASRLLSLSSVDLAGKFISSFLPSCPNLHHFQQQEKCASGLPMEFDLQRADGATIPVEVYCNLYEAENDQLHCLLVVRDISHSNFLDEERAARLAKLTLLNQVNEALYGAHLSLDKILEAVLICVTAGQGLRFNRAFLLLIDETQQVLRGEIAIGPSNREEAERIWRDLAGQHIDLYEMMTDYGTSSRQTDVVVNEIVQKMSVDLNRSDHLLVRAMHERRAYRVNSQVDISGYDSVRKWLNSAEFAVAPLTTRRGPLGIIVADNAITGDEISDLDLEFLQLYASVSANAIENSRLYHELERRLVDLRKVTERQKADQETLLRMERLSVMGETSAIVAHELRNPLVAIGGFARTLLRSLADDDPNRRFAEIITEEVTRLERIIHDLLDFIRPQKLLRKSVLGDELVRETVLRYKERMEEQGIEVEFDLQAESVSVNVNPSEIQQVLQNLLINAMQVMSDGGQLIVRSRHPEGGFQVEIMDSGPGFTEDLSDKLFAPFFTTKVSGSGLGLTISNQIVKAHGGVLSARNRKSGGACFTFILPLPKPHPSSGT